MQINIKARSFYLTSSLRSHAERRLRFTLTRYCDRIQHVVMRLSEVYHLHGELNKRCHLQVVVAGIPDVVVETTEADLYTAIDRATDRAERSVALRLQNSRSFSVSDVRSFRAYRSHLTQLQTKQR